ncbi:MAG: hypothetical protein WCW03_01115 [Candidatus Paceibacterota bacterium]
MKPKYAHLSLFIVAIITLFSTIAIYVYMYYANNSIIERAISARNITNREISNKDQENDLSKLYESTIGDRQKINALLIGNNEIVSFVEALEALGSKSGSEVKISALTAENTNNQTIGATSTLRAHVEINGSWNSVMRTLKLSETLPYGITIGDVRLGPSGGYVVDKTKLGKWTAEYDISAIVIKI